MTCHDIREREVVAQYVHRRLSDAERDLFEEHLLGCERCFSELQDYRVLRQELAGELAHAVTAPRRPWWRLSMPVLAATAAAAVMVVAVLLPGQAPMPDTGEPVPPAAVVAPSAEPRSAPAPVDSGADARARLLARLARFEPPVYQPSTLRSAGSDADQRFRSAMEPYMAGDFPKAATALRAVREDHPQSSDTVFYLAVTELQLGRIPQAIAELERLVALGDVIYEEDAHYFLAKAHLASGDAERGRVELRKVVELAGDREQEAREALRELTADR